jgi:hypothetical protein
MSAGFLAFHSKSALIICATELPRSGRPSLFEQIIS